MNRVFISAGRLVVSEPGHDATDPTLQDEDKVFDSNWFFGSQIIENGLWTFQDETAPMAGGGCGQNHNSLRKYKLLKAA